MRACWSVCRLVANVFALQLAGSDLWLRDTQCVSSLITEDDWGGCAFFQAGWDFRRNWNQKYSGSYETIQKIWRANGYYFFKIWNFKKQRKLSNGFYPIRMKFGLGIKKPLELEPEWPIKTDQKQNFNFLVLLPTKILVQKKNLAFFQMSEKTWGLNMSMRIIMSTYDFFLWARATFGGSHSLQYRLRWHSCKTRLIVTVSKMDHTWVKKWQ